MHLVAGANADAVTGCCGTWPVGRSPFTTDPRYHRWRYVTSLQELDLLRSCPWHGLRCYLCQRDIET